jgi:hypothetical protein
MDAEGGVVMMNMATGPHSKQAIAEIILRANAALVFRRRNSMRRKLGVS